MPAVGASASVRPPLLTVTSHVGAGNPIWVLCKRNRCSIMTQFLSPHLVLIDTTKIFITCLLSHVLFLKHIGNSLHSKDARRLPRVTV